MLLLLICLGLSGADGLLDLDTCLGVNLHLRGTDTQAPTSSSGIVHGVHHLLLYNSGLQCDEHPRG